MRVLRTGPVLVVALVLAVSLSGCEAVGEFGDWAGSSVSTTVALIELTNDIRSVDGVEGAEFTFDPGAGDKTAAVEVRIRDDTDAAWLQAGEVLAARAADERLAAIPVSVGMSSGDGVTITVVLAEAASPSVADGVEGLLALHAALDAPLLAQLGADYGAIVLDVEPTQLVGLLADPELRPVIDGLLDQEGALSIQSPGLHLYGSVPPDAVFELYAEMLRVLPSGVCGIGGCVESTPQETVGLDWAGEAFSLSYFSQEHPLEAPSAEAVELVRLILAVEAAPGAIDYFFADPEAAGSFPSAHLEAGGCTGERQSFDDASEANNAAFRAGLAAAGLEVPLEQFGYCPPVG